MRKLISFLMAVLIALPLYSKDPEYVSVGKQFNTVVVNVPAVISINKSQEHSVKITNESREAMVYTILNDTLFIKAKNIVDVNEMESERLKIQLSHPDPMAVYKDIQMPRGLGMLKSKTNKGKSGNQK